MKSKGTSESYVWVAREKHTVKNPPLLIYQDEPQSFSWGHGCWKGTQIIGQLNYRHARRLGILKISLRPGKKRRVTVGEVFGG